MATNIEQFVVTLLERLLSLLWSELQTWLAQPGNFEKALVYIDEILANAGINVPPVSPTPTPAPVPGTPTPVPGTPAPAPTPAAVTAQSVKSAAATVASWFPGAKG